MKKSKYWLPFAIILILLVASYFLGVLKYFTFESLKENQANLHEQVSAHPILAPLVFIFIYIVTVILLLPVGIFLSVVGGFLFSWPLNILYVLFGATAGSCILFLITKTAMHTLFEKIAGPQLRMIEKEFQKDAINYLLFLRLMPLSPFWLVNLASAFFGVRFWTFTWTTLVGNAPPTIAFIEIGRELETLFNSGKAISLQSILSWKISLALLALAILSILPIFIKKWCSR